MATVITNLLSAIPVIGEQLVEYIWGGFSVGNATLNRFYSFHYLLPFVLVGLSIAHLITLHEVGGSNPLGVNSKMAKINFHPYYTLKDFLGFVLFFIFFSIFIFYFPNVLGHSDNYIEADPLVTPTHIQPEWFLLAFYAILRAIPNKILGVVAMVLAILILIVTYYVHISLYNSSLFRPFYKFFLILFFFNFILLTWVGQAVVEDPYIFLGQIFSFYYFLFFLVITPFVSFLELLLLYYSNSFFKS